MHCLTAIGTKQTGVFVPFLEELFPLQVKPPIVSFPIVPFIGTETLLLPCLPFDSVPFPAGTLFLFPGLPLDASGLVTSPPAFPVVVLIEHDFPFSYRRCAFVFGQIVLILLNLKISISRSVLEWLLERFL